MGQAERWVAPRSPTLLQINQTNGGEQSRPHIPGLQLREIKPQTSELEHLWGLGQQQEKLPASQERSLERPTGAWSVRAHPLGNQHQRGPIGLWVAGEVTENQQRVEQVALFPLGPSPTYRLTATSVTPPW